MTFSHIFLFFIALIVRYSPVLIVLYFIWSNLSKRIKVLEEENAWLKKKSSYQ